MSGIAQYLPVGLAFEDAVALMAALAAFITFAAIWQTLLVRDPMKGRLKELQARRDGLRSDLLVVRKRKPLGIEPDAMGKLLKRFNLLRGAEAGKATIQLAQAGFRSRDALIIFMFAKLCLPIALGLIFMVLVVLLKVPPLPQPVAWGLAFLSVLIGWAGPELYVKNVADKRRTAIRKAMPDGLDLLVICAEAGLSVDAALTRAAREIALSSPELADELGLTAIELTFLPERQKAFENLNLRCNLPAVRGLVNTLKQTEKYGTPLARSLRVLSAEFREERLLKAEEKAARLPALLTVPMIIFILPPLFIVLVGPAILRVIDTLRGIG